MISVVSIALEIIFLLPCQAVWSKCFVRFVKLIYLQLGGLQLVFIPLPVHYDQSELLIAFM